MSSSVRCEVEGSTPPTLRVVNTGGRRRSGPDTRFRAGGGDLLAGCSAQQEILVTVTAPDPTAIPPAVDPARDRRGPLFALGWARYLALGAVAGLAVTTLATFGVAVGKTVALVGKVLSGGGQDDLVIVSVLEAIDAYLLAVVQLVVLVGLADLFVGVRGLPPWLVTRSLEDLKKPIIDVLVIFTAIKGIEMLLVATDPMDALQGAGAVAVLVLSLTAYRKFTAPRAP